MQCIYMISVFLCIGMINCDNLGDGESRTVGGLSSVDDQTLEELRKNISESFVQLASESGKSVQLKQVLGAQKQVVAGVLYKVRTVVDTGNGPENCIIEGK